MRITSSTYSVIHPPGKWGRNDTPRIVRLPLFLFLALFVLFSLVGCDCGDDTKDGSGAASDDDAGDDDDSGNDDDDDNDSTDDDDDNDDNNDNDDDNTDDDDDDNTDDDDDDDDMQPYDSCLGDEGSLSYNVDHFEVILSGIDQNFDSIVFLDMSLRADDRLVACAVTNDPINGHKTYIILEDDFGNFISEPLLETSGAIDQRINYCVAIVDGDNQAYLITGHGITSPVTKIFQEDGLGEYNEWTYTIGTNPITGGAFGGEPLFFTYVNGNPQKFSYDGVNWNNEITNLEGVDWNLDFSCGVIAGIGYKDSVSTGYFNEVVGGFNEHWISASADYGHPDLAVDNNCAAHIVASIFPEPDIDNTLTTKTDNTLQYFFIDDTAPDGRATQTVLLDAGTIGDAPSIHRDNQGVYYISYVTSETIAPANYDRDLEIIVGRPLLGELCWDIVATEELMGGDLQTAVDSQGNIRYMDVKDFNQIWYSIP